MGASVATVDIDMTCGQRIELDVSQKVSVIGALDYPIYGGPYDATPTVDGLTLATKQKLMTKDVSVEPIPIGSVSNDSGGRTVTIG